VLEEGDERGRDGHHLARRDIHVADVFCGEEVNLSTLLTGQNAALSEAGGLGQRGVGLRDDVLVFFACREVVDRCSDDAINNAAVRRLNETEGVDASERCE
jgi:hypothetical protein